MTNLFLTVTLFVSPEWQPEDIRCSDAEPLPSAPTQFVAYKCSRQLGTGFSQLCGHHTAVVAQV